MIHKKGSYVIQANADESGVFVMVNFNMELIDWDDILYLADAANCYIQGDRLSYNGTLTVSKLGEACHPWIIFSHVTINGVFPEAKTADAENYCRNPKYFERPWCYVEIITPTELRHGYCDVPLCPGIVHKKAIWKSDL